MGGGGSASTDRPRRPTRPLGGTALYPAVYERPNHSPALVGHLLLPQFVLKVPWVLGCNLYIIVFELRSPHEL